MWLLLVADIPRALLANPRALNSRNAHGPITSLQKQSKKPYNKELINLERSVFAAKSQTWAMPYCPLRFSRKDLSLG